MAMCSGVRNGIRAPAQAITMATEDPLAVLLRFLLLFRGEEDRPSAFAGRFGFRNVWHWVHRTCVFSMEHTHSQLRVTSGLVCEKCATDLGHWPSISDSEIS